MSTPETLTRELAALDDALAGRPVDPDLAELAELAILVRDERPAPDPVFVRSLDGRARRGFTRLTARRRSVWPKLTLPALGLAASALVVIVIATSSQGGSAGDKSAGGGGTAATSKVAPPSAAGDEAAPASPPSGTAAIAAGRRYVERSAQITLVTRPRDVDRDAKKILTVADDLGGYVATSQVSSGSGGDFELRVPERHLDSALERLSGIGKVRGRTEASQDITGAVVSARSRLKDARTERRSLLRQLAAATTTNQTTSIRERLRIVSGQIAAAKRDVRRETTRARYSTIAVTLVADRSAGAAPGGRDGWTPGDALGDAARILEVSASVLLVAGAVALPLALVALLVWLAARQAAHRRRERALDAV